ncbi:threonine dehydratase [Virgisporangium aliadipatigenens]|uniref:threonine ammonia-lyase n=1 Tax=Virgisporangium aliadipatigenens TaxID=741659 RepID=A0A8J3YJL3_9ACTN|nr:threonine dehydratase [Virgisporangium aliadipatigenens]
MAARRIAGRVRRTPVSEAVPGAVWFKHEYLQVSGSFKARGAFNRILSAEVPAAGVIAASGGNAGMAVAYAARALGVPAEVFVPVSAPPVKVAKLRRLGASVVQVGAEYAEAFHAALKRAADSGASFVHAYDQVEVCAGQGTLAVELAEQVPVDTVLLAVGGGGLMAGVAAALEGRARVVAVEPVSAPTLHRALAAGEPVDVAVSGVAADSLGAHRVGAIGFDVAVRTGVRSVLVSDADVVAARLRLWDEFRVVVEHGTASALAALDAGVYRPEPGERVAVLLCGANTDPSDLG